MCPSSTSSSEPRHGGATDEGLIEVPLPRRTPRGRAFVVAAILIANTAILVGTGLVDTLFPYAAPQPIGIEKAQDEARRASATWRNGSAARLLEDDLRRGSRVRHALGGPYTEFLFRSLREAGSAVVVGREGMMFIKDRLQLPAGDPDLAVRRSSAVHMAFQRRFAALGVVHLVLPIPRKGAVCSDWLPMGWLGHTDRDQAVVQGFRERGVQTVDLVDAMLQGDASTLFLRMDTHWSTQGMDLCARATAAFLGALAPPGKRLGILRTVPAETTAPVGDLPNMIGIQLKPSDAPQYLRPMLEIVGEEGYPLPPGGPQSRAVLCGTSFSAHGLFAGFLSHYLGTPIESHAIAGGSPHASLAAMMHAREVLPELVLEEIPLHLVHAMGLNAGGWVVFPGAGDVFAQHGPPAVLPIEVQTGVIATLEPFGTALPVQGGRVLLEVGDGWVGHGGDGVLELEIDGEVLEGEVRLDVSQGLSVMSVPWTPGRHTVTIPCIRAESSSDGLRVVLASLTPAASFNLHGARLVTAADAARPMPGTPAHLERSESGWRQGLEWPAGTHVPAHGTLVVRTEPQRSSVGDVRVRVWAEGLAEPLEFPIGTLHPAGAVVLQLAALRDRELQRVEVSGSLESGGVLPDLVRGADLYPLAVPR
ncbi:MAG: hypothetical protein R3F17_13765 [Planctomycetota bacterium]